MNDVDLIEQPTTPVMVGDGPEPAASPRGEAPAPDPLEEAWRDAGYGSSFAVWQDEGR